VDRGRRFQTLATGRRRRKSGRIVQNKPSTSKKAAIWEWLSISQSTAPCRSSSCDVGERTGEHEEGGDPPVGIDFAGIEELDTRSVTTLDDRAVAKRRDQPPACFGFLVEPPCNRSSRGDQNRAAIPKVAPE
jgi:hypothetical protein